MAVAENAHFVDIFYGHTPLLALLLSLVFIFLVFHPFQMIVEKVLGGARHLADGEESIGDVFHGFIPLLLRT